MFIKSFNSKSLILSFAFSFVYSKCKKGMYVALCLFVIGLSSCYQHYYRTNTQQSTDADILKRLQTSDKYFIIHFPDRNSALRNITINQNNIEGDEAPLPNWHSGELKPNPSGTNAVPHVKMDSVLTEVHLYTSNNGVPKGRVSIPLSEINRMDVYEYDQKATRLNHTLSTVGVTITTLIAVSAVAFAIACNCPQVYIEENGNTHFNGGLYSGAIYSTLERTDYMPLPAIDTDNTKIKLSIKNVAGEEQFINSIQLLKVNHHTDENVLADRHGQIHSYKQLQSPLLQNITDHDVLSKRDGKVYSFNTTSSEHTSELVLKFKSEQKEGKAKLIVHAKNSGWSGYIFREFSSLFGENAEAWRNKQEKADPAVLKKWQADQSLPLMISVKNGDSWKFVDYLPLTGNTASRDMIIAFDFVKNNSDDIEVKLETVYRFWDLDFVGLELTKSSLITKELIYAKTATDKGGIDQTSAIASNDKKYSHLVNDDAIDLQFDIFPPASNMQSTYFLVSKGYYHNLAKFSGKAKTMELLHFKKSGGFNNFSRRKYQSINQELAKYTVKSKPSDK